MSLSRPQRTGLTPQEIEFMAMEHMVDIVPLFSMKPLKDLDVGPPDQEHPGSYYGPFVPPQKRRTPMWLAIHLKKRRRCRIVIPLWMTVGELETTLRQETASTEFSELPDDYLEVSKALLEAASDDIISPDRIRILLKDIREIRQSKVREGIKALNPIHLAMPNASTMEMNEIRQFFTLTFKRLVTLHPDNEQHVHSEERWEKDQLRHSGDGIYENDEEAYDEDMG